MNFLRIKKCERANMFLEIFQINKHQISYRLKSINRGLNNYTHTQERTTTTKKIIKNKNKLTSSSPNMFYYLGHNSNTDVFQG